MRRRAWVWIVALPTACVAYQWLIHALIVDTSTTSLRVGLAVLNGVPHAAVNLFLLWVFGRTLVHGREALITGFARRVHGSLPPYIESYSRGVTWAWCVFFGAQLAVSALLFFLSPLETWSFFVNVLGSPLVALMFALEYACRIVRFPDYPHASIWQSIQAFTTREPVPGRTETRSQS